MLKDTDFNNSHCKMSFNDHQRLVTNALAVTANENLGWEFGEQIQLTTLGSLGYAALSCATLGGFLNVIARFLHLRTLLFKINVEVNEAEAYLTFEDILPLSDTRYFLLSAAVNGAVQVIRLCFSEPLAIKRIEMACSEPDHWSHVIAGGKYPVVFESKRTRVVIDSVFLSYSLATADPITQKEMYALCIKQDALHLNQKDLIARTRDFIHTHPRLSPSLDDASAHFFMSSRTYRRELNRCDTSYQKVLDEERAKTAKKFLAQGYTSVSVIADKLGFNDPSNFSKAFKKWTGISPAQWRA
ncbi:AraC family transcriptional regulator ligand-binding domain-containing protein [Alteromonas sp. MMG017]|nr:AraC family transcriptional regulator ligand-binding domain-containing protein [Alteromonas sp. MMG017]